MNRKLYYFYLIDIALYPLLVCVFIPFSLPATSIINSNVEVSFWLPLCIVFWLISIVIARLWLRAGWHAMLAFAVGVGLAGIIEASPKLVKACLLRPYEEQYDSGELRIKGTCVRGINHGIFTYYAEDGHIEKTETWSHGRINGECCLYHENGTLAAKGMKIGEYEMDLWDDSLVDRYGRWEFYREDGTLDDVRVYDENKVVSSQKYEFYRMTTGSTNRICSFSDHSPFTGKIEKKAILEEYGPSYLYTVNLVDGVMEGDWLCYYDLPDYPLASKGNIRKGYSEGAYMAFHPNGQIWLEATYRHGLLEGEYTIYYADSAATRPYGQMQYRCTYAGDERHGTARWWYANGALEVEAAYVEGKQHGFYRSYDEQEQLLEESFYLDGNKHGSCKTYQNDGSYAEATYRNDKKITERLFYPGGRLKSFWTSEEGFIERYDTDGGKSEEEENE